MIPAILGAAGPLFGLIDDLFTSDEERAEAKRKLIALEQKGELQKVLGQLQINMQEAKSESRFVSGWRPFIGWICGSAFAYHFLLQPFALFAVATWGDASARAAVQSLPELDLSAMMPVLLGMLGLGGMRSFEKYKKANKNR